MHSLPSKAAGAEDVDLFEFLEQWETTNSTISPLPRTPFGSAPALSSYVGAQDSFPLPSQARALSTPVPGIPHPPDRAIPLASYSPAFQQPLDQAPGEAAYLMYAPALYLKARHIRGNLGPREHPPPALASWQQQPPPRRRASSANIAQGTCYAHGLLHKPDLTGTHAHAWTAQGT